MKIHSIVGLLVVLCFASSSNAFLNSGGEDLAAGGGIADILTPIIGVKKSLIAAIQEKVQKKIEKKKAIKQKLLGSVTSLFGGAGAGGLGGLLGGAGGLGGLLGGNGNGLVDGGAVAVPAVDGGNGGQFLVADTSSGSSNGGANVNAGAANGGIIVEDANSGANQFTTADISDGPNQFYVEDVNGGANQGQFGSGSSLGSGSISSSNAGSIVTDFNSGGNFAGSGSNSIGLTSPTETFRGPSSYDAGYEYPQPSQTFVSPPEPITLEYIPPTPHVEYGPAINYPAPQKPEVTFVPPAPAPAPLVESHHSGNGCSELALPHQDVPAFDVRQDSGFSSNQGQFVPSRQTSSVQQTVSAGPAFQSTQNRVLTTNTRLSQARPVASRPVSTVSTGSVVSTQNSGSLSSTANRQSYASDAPTEVIGDGVTTIGEGGNTLVAGGAGATAGSGNGLGFLGGLLGGGSGGGFGGLGGLGGGLEGGLGGIVDIKKKLIAAKKAKIQKKVDAITKLFSGLLGGGHGGDGGHAVPAENDADSLTFSGDVH